MLPERPAIAPQMAAQTCNAGDDTVPSTDAQVADQTGAMSTEEAQGDTVNVSAPTEKRLRSRVRRPVTPSEQLESELWAARLGFCGWGQLEALPGKVDGIPTTFKCHPFRFIDHKEAAAIKKRASGKHSVCLDGAGQRFYMDFGFLRAPAAD
jgi:hypothetical protein